MLYFHVDVFSDKVLSGNGLTVVLVDKEIEDPVLLRIAQEFRQFETVFVYQKKTDYYPVRVFTVQEELPFAGHPIIGTAAVLHDCYFNSAERQEIKIGLGEQRIIRLQSTVNNGKYSVVMNQGIPRFINKIDKTEYKKLSGYFNLSEKDISREYPVEVVSTGLEYILIPVITNLENAEITKSGLESYIQKHSAKFAYLFNPETLECRCWDNTGAYEDIATGSAAGPLISYLVKNGYYRKDEKVRITQGKYLNRESIISGWVSSKEQDVYIEGNVTFFGKGEISI